MSDSARPGPSQVTPAESRSLEAAVDPIAAAFSVPPEAPAPEVGVTSPPKPDAADGDGDGKELLLLQNDADEPPIYFEPDAEAGPFMPAMTPAPAVAVANISVDLDDDDEPVPPTVNSPSDLPPPSPVVELTPSSGEVPATGNGAASASADGAVTAADGPQDPAPAAVAAVAVAAAAVAPVAVAPAAVAQPEPEPVPEEPAASASAGPPTERSLPSEPPAVVSSAPSSPPSAPISSLQDGQLLPSSDPGRRAVSHSTSVPPPRVRANRSQRPGGSARPSGMIEPARIIAVLGSDVPAYTKGSANGEATSDEIEDLDDSEAQELPEGAPSERQTRRSADSTATPGIEARGDAAPASVPVDSTTPLPSESTQKRPKPPSPPSARAARKAAEDAVGKKAWWEDMFSEEFLRAIPVLSPPQLERETAFVARSLNVPKGKRLLDLACGAGQHAVELAARGYSVVGYDLSQAQLAWASELALERGQALEFMHGDMRDLDFSDAFDGVYCWNTSFGFFEEEKNIDIARRVLRSLKPGGRFLLDVVNRDFIVSQQPGQTWFEGDGCVCIDDVGIDFVSSRINVKRTLMLDNGRNRECNYSIRLYNLHELGKLLTDVGFNVLQASGRPELPGVFMGPTSPRIILLAAKPAA
jgi:SAM-dependent methyltransferase